MSNLRARLKRLTKEEAPPSIWDEDPMVAIEKRLDEVRLMAKPRRDVRHVLDRLEPAQRELILKYKDMPIAEVRKKRRKQWRFRDRLLWAMKMVRLLIAGFLHSKKYYVDLANANQLRKKIEKLSENPMHATEVPLRSSLGHELQMSISTQPRYRDRKYIKRIMWLLRATKAFKHLFPAEMEPEVAKYVAYERYDDGRILAYQGRAPDRFLYVISGRVNMLRQYQLSTGQITKSMGFLTKGMTTDPEEMNQQWLREDTLVAKGQVEVLVLDGKAFNFLQHTTQGPPIEFLKSLDLFEEFPIHRFLQASDSIDYTYYGQGKLIIKDSNRTPWLYIVKSGAVKVVRFQSVLDSKACNESKFNALRMEELGCGKNDSHAEAMLGVQARQKKFKAAKLRLPVLDQNANVVSSAQGSSESHQERIEKWNKCYNSDEALLNDKKGRFIRTYSSKSRIYRHKSVSKARSEVSVNIQEPSEKENTPNDDKSSVLETESLHLGSETSSTKTSSTDSSSRKRAQARRSVELPQLGPNRTQLTGSGTQPEVESSRVSRKKSVGNESEFHKHDLWLTREKTEAESVFPKKRTEKLHHREAFLQLDILSPGDVFGLDKIMSKFIELEGLDHLQPPVASEPHGVSLLSDGAEVIKISKRFFLQNAANNTMLKVETMYKEYITEEEAKQALYDKETWGQYRSVLWDKMMETLHAPQTLR